MTLANWRDLSVVFLVIQAFIINLIPAAILFFAIKGMLWVIRKLRGIAPTVQGYFRKAADISEQVSQRAAAPFIATSATLAQVNRWRSSTITLLKSTKEVSP